MKKTILFLSLTIALSGCSATNDNMVITEESTMEVANEIPVDFTLERATLSKGYQSLSPRVEIVDKAHPSSILVSLGLVECSGASIDKITRFNNEINIYTSQVNSSDNKDIVVPQFNIQINNLDTTFLQNAKFNIIGTNYKPIELIYEKNEALNNIYAQLKVTSNTSPKINIIKNKTDYLWDITLNNVYAKSIPNNPLVNVRALVDTFSGEITDFDIVSYSDYIAEGTLFDYSSKGYLLYKHKSESDGKIKETLWLYNLKDSTKVKIHSTYNSIYTALFSPDSQHIALIENDKDISNIYVIDLKNNTTQKITPMDHNHIWNMSWQDDMLYFVDIAKSNKSFFFEYDLKTSNVTQLFVVSNLVSSFQVNNGNFIFNEYAEEILSTSIYATEQGNDIKEIDTGFNIDFLSDDKIIYLKNAIDNKKNTLWIYNLTENSKVSLTDLDIRKYYIKNKDTLILIGRSSYIDEFSLFEYDLVNDNITSLGRVLNQNIFYDSEANIGYINEIPAIDGIKESRIYSIDMSKLSMAIDLTNDTN